jgi:hypothetical protein
VERFIFPMDGNFSVGAAFEKAFFQEQPLNHPIAWRPGPVVGRRDTLRFTADCSINVPTTTQPLRCARLMRGINGLAMPYQNELIMPKLLSIVHHANTIRYSACDSENGPYLSAHRLGKGLFGALAAKWNEGEKQIVLEMITALSERLVMNDLQFTVKQGEDSRKVIGLIALENGPESGGWANVKCGGMVSAVKAIAWPIKTVEFRE